MSIANFNTQIIGRLGNDAEVRNVGEYNAISFSIAISEKRKNDQYVTSWINCTYWSKSDKILQYLKKGKLISVVADWFEVKESEGKRYFNFRVKDLNPFLEKNEPTAAAPTSENGQSVRDENPFAGDDDDDLPF
jgi:single-stranded DNA-binding protein